MCPSPTAIEPAASEMSVATPSMRSGWAESFALMDTRAVPIFVATAVLIDTASPRAAVRSCTIRSSPDLAWT